MLHISANQLPLWDKPHHTHKIWNELSRGFDEYHLLGRSKDNHFHTLRKGNITIHLVPALGRRNRSFFLTGFHVFRVIRKEKITHLLAQSPVWGGVAATLASRYFRIPLMVEIHGDVYFSYWKSAKPLEKILGSLAKFSLKKASRVRSLSPKMTDILRSYEITDNVTEIPNRVDLQLFDSPKREYALGNPVTLLSIGRFVEQKGYSIAISCMQALAAKYNIQLILIGGGKEYQKLNVLIGSSDRIQLIEWMPQEKLIEWIQSADIYLQPSLPDLGEAMPRTILEAMAMGLPIIASEIAAIPGVLNHEENALLIAPGKTESLIEAIEKMIENPGLRKRLGTRARKDVEAHYEWNRSFDRYRQELLNMNYAHR